MCEQCDGSTAIRAAAVPSAPWSAGQTPARASGARQNQPPHEPPEDLHLHRARAGEPEYVLRPV